MVKNSFFCVKINIRIFIGLIIKKFIIFSKELVENAGDKFILTKEVNEFKNNMNKNHIYQIKTNIKIKFQYLFESLIFNELRFIKR